MDYRPRKLDVTLRDTIDWNLELLGGGVLRGGRPSTLSVTAAGMRVAGRLGLLRGVGLAERYAGRRLVAGR